MTSTEKGVAVTQIAKIIHKLNIEKDEKNNPPCADGEYRLRIPKVCAKRLPSSLDVVSSLIYESNCLPNDMRPKVVPILQEQQPYVPKTYPKNLPEGEPAPKPQKEQRPKGSRQYDIVIYGATGFTGALMAEHLDALVASSPTYCSWAIAGRDAGKLNKMAERCSTRPGIIVIADKDELAKSLTAQTHIVVNTVGPYAVHGEAVVKACIEQGTHYIDVTGETVFVHQMIERYHTEAKARGVMVVFCAGQVAAPDDINCFLLAQKLGPLKQFREYFFSYGAMTGGTFATNITTQELMNESFREVQKDPFNMGGHRCRGICDDDRDILQTVRDPLFGGLWLFPAYNSSTGGRLVRRSCALFEEFPSSGIHYGSDIVVCIRDATTSEKGAQQQCQWMAPGPVEKAREAAALMADQVQKGEMPRPGEGPPADTRKLYFSDVWAVAEGENGTWAHCHYTGPESYEVTAMCAVTGALVLHEEKDKIDANTRAGMVTPAFAFHGTSWIQRLQSITFGNRQGKKMKFEVLLGKPTESELKTAMTEKTKNATLGQSKLMDGIYKRWALPDLLA